MVRTDIESAVQEVLSTFGMESKEVLIEHPALASLGDFATNAAIVYAKKIGKSPQAFAGELIEKLLEKHISEVEKIEVAGTGFVNFFLSREYFTKNTNEILSHRDAYGTNKTLAGKKVIVEYTDPNPFKEFHIGHLMSNAIGESISRLIEASGAEVKRACYQGDVGLHVAKAVWGMKTGEKELGQAYARGSRAYDEDERAKKEISELNKTIYAKNDSSVNELYGRGRKESLEKFEGMYQRLGTTFDSNFNFFESETGPVGVDLVRRNLGKVFEESDGAIVFRGERAGLHTRVFITTEGLPTYESKELGLAKLKQEKYGADVSVVVTGNEVTDYFKVVLAAMKEIPELSWQTEKIVHIPHGMLRLPSGKMSSRTGDVISAEDLLAEIRARLTEKIDPSNEKLLNDVSVAAVKYSMLKQEAKKDIIFDIEKSISLSGDSGPYLEYTYARCRSILEKAKGEGIAVSVANPSLATLGIERKLSHFPEVVLRAAEAYAPHYLATYLYELAGAFNTFYNNIVIVKTNDPESSYKCAVTDAVGTVLARGLSLLGIAAPERM